MLPVRAPACTTFLVLILVWIAGCGSPPAPPARPEAAPRATLAKDADPGLRREPSPLAHLPADTTLAAVVVDSPGGLARRLSWPAPLTKHPKLHAEIREEMIEELGADYTRLESWTQVGIDTRGPCGLAVFQGDNFNVTLFATVTDFDALEAFIRRSVRGDLREQRYGAITALLPESSKDVAFAFAGDLAFYVWVDDRDDREAILRRLGATRLADSIAGDREVRRGLAAVGEAHVTGLLAFGPIGELLVQETGGRRNLDYLSDLEQKLNELRSKHQMNPTPDLKRRIASLERRIASENRWRQRRERRSRGVRTLARRGLAPLGPMVIGVDLDGGDAALRGWIAPAAGSLPARLLSRRGSSFARFRRAWSNPLFALAGRVDPVRTLEAIDMVLRADGGSLDDARSGLASMGMSLDRGTRLLTGDFTVALSAASKRLLSADGLGLLVAAGIDDADRARDYLRDAARQPKLREVRGPDGNSLVFPVLRGQKATTALTARDVLVSTDVERHRAALSSAAANETESWTRAETAVLGDSRNLMVGVLDLPRLIAMVLTPRHAFAASRYARPDMAKSPKIERLRRQERELARRIAEVEDELGRLASGRLAERIGSMGRISVALRHGESSGDPLRIEGVYDTGYDELGPMLGDLFGIIADPDGDRSSPRIRELRDRRSELHRERYRLWDELRRADAAARQPFQVVSGSPARPARLTPVFTREQSRINACFRASKAQNAEVTVEMTIEPSGKVDAAGIFRRKRARSRVTRCVLRIVRGLRFSSSAVGKSPVVLRHTFESRP